MKKFLSGLCATALAVSFAASATAPAAAAPFSPPMIKTTSDVIQVDNRWRGGGGRNWGGRNWNGNGNWGRHGGYYGGHYNNDIGIGIGAAIAGALITGAIINSQSPPAYRVYDDYYPRRVYRTERVYRRAGGDVHTDWCYNRYRSYRAWDNTFQPYNGARRECFSPY